MPMGWDWTNGLVFGLNVEDCGVYDEEEDTTEEGSVVQVYLGFVMFYVIIRS